MGFEIVCDGCGTAIFAGYDLKSAKDIMKLYESRCKNCGAALSPFDFALEVVRL